MTRLAVVLLCLMAGIAAGALAAFVRLKFVAALPVAAVGGLILLRSAQMGLAAVIGVAALLPFAAIPLNIGFNPTFLDLALLALIGVWLASVLTRRQGELITSPLDLPVLAFILLAIFAFIAGLGHAALSKEVIRRFAEVILGISLFYVTINVVRSQQDLERAVLLLMLCGAAAAALGVLLYFLPDGLTIRLLSLLRVFNYPSGSQVLRFIEDNPELPQRATSTSVDPNVLGGLLILTTALTAPQLFARRPLLPRALIAAMLAVMGLCLILTFSRGALLGLTVALTMVGLVRYRRLLWLLALGALVMLILPQSRFYVTHLIEGLRGEDLATRMRFGEYQDALRLIARYPWFGVGFAAAPDIDLYIGVSSVYLLMAEEMGLVGLGVFLGVMALFFAHAWNGWRAMEEDSLQPILLGLMAALLGAMVGGVFDHYFFNLDFPHSVSLFWMYVGLAMAAVQLQVAGHKSQVTSRKSQVASRRSQATGCKSQVASRKSQVASRRSQVASRKSQVAGRKSQVGPEA